MAVESQRVEDFRLTKEPYYLPLGNEVELFESAYHARLPVMLKGPTGCGKTRFVEHMSWRLERTLVTVACHEDLTATDLVGRYLLRGDETIWHGRAADDGRQGRRHLLPRRDRRGAQGHHRRHPPAHRRPAHPAASRRTGEIVAAPDEFLLVISYNPGYQIGAQGPQALTTPALRGDRVRLPAAGPRGDDPQAPSAAIDDDTAAELVKIGEKVRNLRDPRPRGGRLTRLLVYAGQLIQGGVEPIAACEATICKPITDDLEMQRSIVEIIATQF